MVDPRCRSSTAWPCSRPIRCQPSIMQLPGVILLEHSYLAVIRVCFFYVLQELRHFCREKDRSLCSRPPQRCSRRRFQEKLLHCPTEIAIHELNHFVPALRLLPTQWILSRQKACSQPFLLLISSSFPCASKSFSNHARSRPAPSCRRTCSCPPRADIPPATHPPGSSKSAQWRTRASQGRSKSSAPAWPTSPPAPRHPCHRCSRPHRHC
mmetsp:Transcript_55509/g.118056  ORF Transcript_55509/g.118056 Transcript_55509/m.118056 type:complete len:210 (-) Transcript_55509:898-1527(-)